MIRRVSSAFILVHLCFATSDTVWSQNQTGASDAKRQHCLQQLTNALAELGGISISELEERAVQASASQLAIAKAQELSKEVRTWYDATGHFSIAAVATSLDKDSVTLTKDDGSTVSVPLSQLHEDSLAALLEIASFCGDLRKTTRATSPKTNSNEPDTHKELVKRLLKNTESDRRAVLRVLNKYKYHRSSGYAHAMTDPITGRQVYRKAVSKKVNRDVAEELMRVSNLDKWCYRPYLTDRIDDGHLVAMPPGVKITGTCDSDGLILSVPLYDVNRKKTGTIDCVAYGMSFDSIQAVDTTTAITAALFSDNALYSHTTITTGTHLKVAPETEFILRDRISVRNKRGHLFKNVPALLEFNPPIQLLDEVIRELNN